MELVKKSFTFTDGRTIEVSESTWEASSIRTRIEEQARADRARLNGSGDPVFLYFVETFYSYLASVSRDVNQDGRPMESVLRNDVPSAEEAYTLPEDDLDRWLLSIIEVNPESFIKVDRTKEGEISFRDGTTFKIVSSYLLSATMKRRRLEEEAIRKEEDPDHPKDIFAVFLYPILASCSVGDVPPAEEIRRTWPESEIYRWRDAIAEVNPHLFGSPEEIEERSTEEARVIQKKKGKSRRRSRPS